MRIRYIWPQHTPCPTCKGKTWWGIKTQGPANSRKCRACGEWFRIEATHEEVANDDGVSSRIQAVAKAAPAQRGK